MLMDQDKDREFAWLLSKQAKQTSLGKISFIYYQTNESRIMG